MRTLFFLVVAGIFSLASGASAEAEAARDLLQAPLFLGISSAWYCNQRLTACDATIDTATNPLPPCSYTKASPAVYSATSANKMYSVTAAYMVLQDDQFGSLRAAVVKDLQDSGKAQTAINWFIRTVMFDVVTSSLKGYSRVNFPDCGDTKVNRDVSINDKVSFSYNVQKRQLRLDFNVKLLMDAITPATTPSIVSGSGPTITTATQVQSMLLQPNLSNMARLSTILNNRANFALSSASFFVNALGGSAYRAPSSIADRVLDFLQRSLLLKSGGRPKPVAGGTTGRSTLTKGH